MQGQQFFEQRDLLGGLDPLDDAGHVQFGQQLHQRCENRTLSLRSHSVQQDGTVNLHHVGWQAGKTAPVRTPSSDIIQAQAHPKVEQGCSPHSSGSRFFSSSEPVA